MIATLCIAASLFLAQARDYHGLIPKEVQTFRMADGQGNDHFVAFRTSIRDGEWVGDISELEGRNQVVVYYDRPWQDPPPDPEPRAISRIGNPIKDFRREERLAAGWEQAGYVWVQAANGQRPVQAKELELARRAQEMAAALEVREVSALNNDGDAAPGFLQQWGQHLLLAVGGLVLIGVVVRMLLLE